MLDFDKDKQCTGCSACAAVCGVNAVQIVRSAKGFYVSQVDETKCVSCGKCEAVCPALKKEASCAMDTATVYDVFSNDTASRRQSTSGGIVHELATQVLEQGGAVCGCVWDENFSVRHVLTDDPQTVEKMRGSKYVQSDLGDCFKQIKAAVAKRKVLFVGTPCQTTALYNIAGGHPNLLLCALVCGGVPSPEVWEKYRDAVVASHGSRLAEIRMRSKKLGWLTLSMDTIFQNGKKQNTPLVLDPYAYAFFQGIVTNEPCFHCPAHAEHIRADLIVGDSWGCSAERLKRSKNQGLSAVIPITEKGKAAFEAVRSGLCCFENDVSSFRKHHRVLFEDRPIPSFREPFFAELETRPIVENLTAHTPPRPHGGVNRLLSKCGLYGPVYTLLYKIRH